MGLTAALLGVVWEDFSMLGFISLRLCTQEQTPIQGKILHRQHTEPEYRDTVGGWTSKQGQLQLGDSSGTP